MTRRIDCKKKIEIAVNLLKIHVEYLKDILVIPRKSIPRSAGSRYVIAAPDIH
jgi:hypothetical protein